jgi:hypothetical protein
MTMPLPKKVRGRARPAKYPDASAKRAPTSKAGEAEGGPGVKKLSISMRAEDFDWARERAAREGSTVSAVLAESVRRRRKAEAWAEVRDALLRGQPALTDEERLAAERELFG